MPTDALEIVAPVVMGIVFILTVGGVAIFRPIAKRAGELLEAMAAEKREPKPRSSSSDTHLMIELLETMNARIDRIEERQDFTDSLLTPGREGKHLPRSRAESDQTA
ncbi:MAG: hypothetical protein EXR95_09180 [Gemmatimonadetes bacterium]|nr:hypothetical protein [Gemmatimonadota bacterium]